MASALWLPNVEFVFGIIGATTAVAIGYILPALVFLRLLQPHDSGPGYLGLGFGAAGGTLKGMPAGPGEARYQAQLGRRRLLALALLAFGIVAGLVCTNAVLGAVQVDFHALRVFDCDSSVGEMSKNMLSRCADHDALDSACCHSWPSHRSPFQAPPERAAICLCAVCRRRRRWWCSLLCCLQRRPPRVWNCT